MRVIEFAGMPRAGKTTQVDRVKAHCESKGLRVISLSESEHAPTVHTPPSEEAMFNLMHGARIVEFYHACLKATPSVDILLLDPGLNAILVRSHFRAFYGHASPEQHRALSTMFYPYAKRVEKTLYFKLSPHDALFRHPWGTALTGDASGGIAYLERVQNAYKRQEFLLHNPYPVDGWQDPDTITEEILAALKL